MQNVSVTIYSSKALRWYIFRQVSYSSEEWITSKV